MIETHVIVDWFSHFEDLTNIIHGSSQLEVIERINHLPFDYDSTTLASFYKCPGISKERGSKPFILYILRDCNPKYALRLTSRGWRMVNSNVFDLKTMLRNLARNNFIHGTDHIQETKDNLKALDLYKDHYDQKKFNSVRDVYQALDQCTNLKWNSYNHDDGYVLNVNNYLLAKSTIDAHSPEMLRADQRYEDNGKNKLNYVIINDKKVFFTINEVY